MFQKPDSSNPQQEQPNAPPKNPQDTPPIPPFDHTPETQEQLINQLGQNTSKINRMIVKLKTSKIEHHQSLATSLETLSSGVIVVSTQITKWGSFRDRCRQFYADGLSYEGVKNINISKQQICSLFVDPKTSQSLPINVKRFPIHWCTNVQMKNLFW